MFYVYILYSEKLNRFYIGSTDNVQKRISEHNSATYADAFTSRGIPWNQFLTIDDLESHQAYAIERHIKKMKSRKYISDLIKHPEIIERLKIKYNHSPVRPR